MTTTIAPVVKERQLACSPAHAFEVFTARIADWWPTQTHAIGDDVVSVVVEPRVGGTIHEVHADGATQTWGHILAWDPPRMLRFSWNLTRSDGTEVEVTFDDDGDGGCAFRLEHRNWEAWGEEAEAARGRYDGGWDVVLAEYQSSAIASSSSSSAMS